jgi:hypothetical protein
LPANIERRDMSMLKTRLAVLILFGAAMGASDAQIIVKQEPMDMRNAATVLVDDGTCGKGKIKLLKMNHGNAMSGAPQRETRCIPR